MAGAVDGCRLGRRTLRPVAAEAGGGLRPQPLVLAAGLAAAALLLHALLWGAQAPLGSAPAIGSVVALGGSAWAARAGWLLWRNRPQRLLDEGPFRIGRNPQYLGGTVALTGGAIALGAPTLVLAAAGFVWAVQRLHIPHEEAALRRAFGGWYSDYCASVRRWL